MRQYTRVYMNSLGEITHVHTQTTPIPPTMEPVSIDPPADATPEQLLEWQLKGKIEHVWDMETFDADESKPETFMRARELIDNMEPTSLATPPRFKSRAKRIPQVELSSKRK